MRKFVADVQKLKKWLMHENKGIPSENILSDSILAAQCTAVQYVLFLQCFYCIHTKNLTKHRQMTKEMKDVRISLPIISKILNYIK